MFIRKNKNRSGAVSVQVVKKVGRRNKVLFSAGSSKVPGEIEFLKVKAQNFIDEQKKLLPLFVEKEDIIVEAFIGTLSSDSLRIVGPQLVLEPLFDRLFPIDPKPYFRDLVLCRIIYPGSKLRTIEYLARHFHKKVSEQTVYRSMDNLDEMQKAAVEDCTYRHTRNISGGTLSLVFYDMTTLYFETESEDDLRKIGYSKDGKHQHPQIMIGLLVNAQGHPVAYDVFEGNKAETKTLLPFIEKMIGRFEMDRPIIVADAALLSRRNLEALKNNGYQYILGGRVRSESHGIKQQILGFSVAEDAPVSLAHWAGRIVVSYSSKRAAKDLYNRQKGLQRLEQKVKSKKLTKEAINNRGYNKYLHLEGDTKVSINYEAFNTDRAWDGLKGYITNTSFSPKEVIGSYSNLWQVENAFRMSKSDLRFRPIYHRKERRIKSHLLICFAAFALFKELERMIKVKQIALSPQKAIETLKEVQEITYQLPKSKEKKTKLLQPSALQLEILKTIF